MKNGKTLPQGPTRTVPVKPAVQPLSGTVQTWRPGSAPPVYRPQAPTAVQAHMHPPVNGLVTTSSMNKKAAGGVAAWRPGSAPPVYRPQAPPAVQPHMHPPVNGLTATSSVNTKAARGAAAAQPGSAPPVYRPQAPPAVQPYTQAPVNCLTATSSMNTKAARGVAAARPGGAPPVYRPQGSQPPLQPQLTVRAVVPPQPRANFAAHGAGNAGGSVLPVLQLSKKEKRKEKKEKKKKSKVKARDKYEPDYVPSPATVDGRFEAYESEEITATSIDDKHFLDFTVQVNGEESEGHINIKGGYALAHVTIAYQGGRLINYYYLVTGEGEIDDPPSGLVSGGVTEKNFSEMPADIKAPIRAMLEDIYS